MLGTVLVRMHDWGNTTKTIHPLLPLWSPAEVELLIYWLCKLWHRNPQPEKKMLLFFFETGILFPKVFWPKYSTMRKQTLVIKKSYKIGEGSKWPWIKIFHPGVSEVAEVKQLRNPNRQKFSNQNFWKIDDIKIWLQRPRKWPFDLGGFHLHLFEFPFMF